MPRFSKPKRIKSSLIGTATLVLFNGAFMSVAFASPQMSPLADLNNDQQIDRAEFMSHSEQRFSETDIDQNGLLTKDEMQAYRKARKAAMKAERLEKIDTNKDGEISKAEKQAHRDMKKKQREAMRLKYMDTNKDGEISDAEKSAFKDKKKAQKSKKKAAYKKSKDKRKGFMRHDTDGDGFISRTEYMTSSEAMFTRMDTNNDGVLTQGEGKRRKKGRKLGHMRPAK